MLGSRLALRLTCAGAIALLHAGCPGTATQPAGECTPPCPAGTQCSPDGVCIRPHTEPVDVEQCPGRLQRCDGQCVDVHSDPNNCNQCGRSCGSQGLCSNGSCTCEQGRHDCNGDLADGCECEIGCSGTACATSCDPQQTWACGNSTRNCSNGQCADCGSSYNCDGIGDCESQSPCGPCESAAEGADCTVASGTGTCHDGGCCTGCWDGSSCQTGTAQPACGDRGEACQSCGTGTCQNQGCVAPAAFCATAPAGASCTSSSGASGRCRDGQCCTGCWTGSQCVAGTAQDKCGDGGDTCDACGSGYKCEGGGCVVDNPCKDNDGATCTKDGKTGRCRDDACCTGCWTGSQCVTGTSDSLCGKQGGGCSNCTSIPAYPYAYVCEAGACVQDNPCAGAADGASCTEGGQTGRCRDEDCCTGCWTGSLCVAGTAQDKCGDGGNACVLCIPGYKCENQDCVVDNPCLDNDGASCTKDGKTGKCRDDACCTGCWYSYGSYCSYGTFDTKCGKNGELCIDCSDIPVHSECVSQKCVAVTNPCLGNDLASCTAGGKTGTCRDDACCTGCWTGTKCSVGTYETECGEGGETCKSCDAIHYNFNCVDAECVYNG